MRISDWNSDVCSSDLDSHLVPRCFGAKIAENRDRRFQTPSVHSRHILGQILSLGLTSVPCPNKKTLFFRMKATTARGGGGKFGGQTPRKSWPPRRISVVTWPDRKSTRLNSSH